MTRSVEATGKTIEDAIESAYSMLGVSRDEADVTIEVVARPKSGFLGIGASPAKVRAIYDDGVEEAPAAPSPVSELRAEPAKAEPKAQQPRRPREPKPEAKQEPKQEREQKPHREPKPEQPRREQRPVQEHQASAPAQEHVEHEEKIPNVSMEELEARRVRAEEFLKGLLERMGAEANVTSEIREENKSIAINLDGENVGMLIGRRGETLGAIQHITGYMANKGSSERVRVVVDAEGYRSKREDALRGLAHRTAMKAVRMRRNITLEPMNAYERHVIHTALQEWRDVSTFSTGAEPRRAVVVAYTPGGGKGEQRERNDRRDDRDRRDRRDRPRRDSAPAQPRPKSEPLPEQVWE